MDYGLRFCLALCLSLTVLPSVSAATQIDVQLDASQLRARQESSIQGSLLTLGEEHAADDQVPADWHLEATLLRQETDHTDFMAGPSRLKPSTSPPSYYTEATVSGVANRPGFRLYIFPMDGRPSPLATSTSDCMTLEQSSSTDYVRQPAVQNSQVRSNLTARTSSSLTWTPCAPTKLTLTGDFRVIFYEWDANLRAGDHSVALTSGKHAKTPGIDTAEILASADEQYLYAWDAVLTIPLGSNPSVYLGPQAHVETTLLELTNAHGAVPQANHLSLRGQLAVDLTASAPSQPVSTRVTGRVDYAEGDGRPLTLTASPPGTFPWGLMVAFGAVLAPAFTIAAVRRRTRRHRVEQLVCASGESSARMQFDHAAALTAKAIDLAPDAPRPCFFHAVALAGQGDLEGALQHHGEVRRLLASERDGRDFVGENAFQTALILARALNPPREEILARLLEAVNAKPGLLIELERHGEFKPYRQQVWASLESRDLLQP